MTDSLNLSFVMIIFLGFEFIRFKASLQFLDLNIGICPRSLTTLYQFTPFKKSIIYTRNVAFNTPFGYGSELVKLHDYMEQQDRPPNTTLASALL